MPLDTEYTFGPFRLHPAARRLSHGDRPVRVGARAFDLLHALVAQAGEPLSKAQLLAQVWRDAVVDDGSIRVHMAALRKALGDAAAAPTYIANLPQRGYCFVAPVAVRAVEDPIPPPAPDSAPAPAASPLAPLVGRDDAIAAVVDRLGRQRLVTLVGPGGIGKTSVATAVVQRLAGRFPDGVRFVDLSTLSDPALAISTLAAALGVPVLGADALGRIVAQLQGRVLLLVLDNCEQIVDAAAALAESLLRRAPGVTLLATSREPLRAQGEWVQRLNRLAAPAGDTGWRAADVLAYPAVQLLVDRVAANVDGFALVDGQADAAVRICRTLDGIPLAIELAAAQAASFGLPHLADLLADRISLLSQGRRSVLARHQTLGATLDWSHGLLDDAERAVLRRLSIFRGPFAIADAIAMGQCPRIDADLAADCVVGLVHKSLVALDGGDDDGPVYRLLDTTRGYAQQRLADSGEWAGIARRHAERVTVQLRDAEVRLGPPPVRIDDVRAALDWAVRTNADPALGVALTVASAGLWFGLGLVDEYRDRLDEADGVRQRLPADTTRDLHLSLARGHAWLHTRGPTEVSDAALSHALAGAQRMGRPEDRLSALWSLYTERMVRGDYAATLALARQFGDVVDEAGAAPPRSTHHRMMAMSLHMNGEHAPALAHAHHALQAPEVRVPYLHGTAYQVDHRASAMAPMARILWIQGLADDAADVVEEAVDRATRLDHGFSSTFTLALAGCPIALWRGDLETAHRYVALLQGCAARHTLTFWQIWGRMYGDVLAWWPHRGITPPDFVATYAVHAGRCDMLGTLATALLHPHALERVDAGRNPWCAVELRRAALERAWRAGADDPAITGKRLRGCVDDAVAQGARSWALRAAITLGEWLHAQGRTSEALDLLGDALAQVPQGHASHDPLRARALLGAWRS